MASAEAAYWRKRLPQRFSFLLERLGRAVIEEQPENIYLFSAEFLEKLIETMNEELKALPQYTYLQQLLKRKKLESFLVTGASRLDYKTGVSSMDVNKAAAETHKSSTGKDGDAAADASKMAVPDGADGQVASPVTIVLEVTAPDKQADEPESDKGSSDVCETQHPSNTVVAESQKVPSMAAIKVDESIQRKQSHHEFKHTSLLDCHTKEDLERFLAMNPEFCPEYQLSALAFPTVDLLIQLKNTPSQQARLEILQQMQKKQAEEQRAAFPEFCPEYQASSLLFSTTALEAMEISHLDESGPNEQKLREQVKEVSQKPEPQLTEIAPPVVVHKPSEESAGSVEIAKSNALIEQMEPKKSFTESDSNLTSETPRLEKSAQALSAQPSDIEKTPSQQLPATEMVQTSGESDARQSSEGNVPTEIPAESAQKAIEPAGPDQQNAAKQPQDGIEAVPVPLNNEEGKTIQPDTTQNNTVSLNIEGAPALKDDTDLNLKVIQGKELVLSTNQAVTDSSNIEMGPQQSIQTNGTSCPHDEVAATNV